MIETNPIAHFSARTSNPKHFSEKRGQETRGENTTRVRHDEYIEVALLARIAGCQRAIRKHAMDIRRPRNPARPSLRSSELRGGNREARKPLFDKLAAIREGVISVLLCQHTGAFQCPKLAEYAP